MPHVRGIWGKFSQLRRRTVTTTHTEPSFGAHATFISDDMTTYFAHAIDSDETLEMDEDEEEGEYEDDDEFDEEFDDEEDEDWEDEFDEELEGDEEEEDD
jgi:hypothetical protein